MVEGKGPDREEEEEG